MRPESASQDSGCAGSCMMTISVATPATSASSARCVPNARCKVDGDCGRRCPCRIDDPSADGVQPSATLAGTDRCCLGGVQPAHHGSDHLPLLFRRLAQPWQRFCYNRQERRRCLLSYACRRHLFSRRRDLSRSCMCTVSDILGPWRRSDRCG